MPDKIVLHYLGGGSLPGVPASDLTNVVISDSRYSADQLVGTGLWERVGDPGPIISKSAKALAESHGIDWSLLGDRVTKPIVEDAIVDCAIAHEVEPAVLPLLVKNPDVELGLISGSGDDGLVLVSDIEAFLEGVE